MERRNFLSYGLSIPGLWSIRSALAQPVAGPRAAVVIGVDKAGDLPILRAAKSGARKVAEWLTGEGFDVNLFVDGDKPVRVAELFDAINAAVARGNLSQLVVYFAGHGFINSYSEHWMLSLAPDNPNEAVSLLESVALARQSAIPNVVFISDACRSRSDSLRTERVRGSLIFPNSRSPSATPSDVDQFLATLVGDSSFEVAVTESVGAYEGIYTGAFLDAYLRPDASMVRTIDGKRVVPNAQLKSYLAREVPLRAERVSIRLKQRPDTQVMSGDATYIGHAVTIEPPPPPIPASGVVVSPAPAPAPATLIDVAAERLGRVGVATVAGDRGRLSEESINAAARTTGFDSARNVLVLARGIPTGWDAKSGFVLTGQRLEAVVINPRVRGDFANAGNPNSLSSRVEVELRGTQAASVALRFADGTGTVLAAIEGYIGNVVVDAGGVNSVSYAPARSDWRYQEYAHNEARIAELHSLVATAARFGVFRIEGARETRNRSAAQMADRIRVLKGIDPTLGIYAAYAYADAGLLNQVQSVMSYMKDDLRVDLFDVAMLSGALSGRPPGDPNGPVPFVPMLSQGWALLRVKNARLPDSVVSAQDHLRPGLWTTLGRDGMRVVESALREGRVR